MKTRWLIGVLAALLVWAPAAEAKGKLTPLIFVHGGAGSGAQFESQGLRFSSNGYPRSYINVFEYDSTTALANLDAIQARLRDYHTKTVPTVELFSRRGLVVQIDATQPPDVVYSVVCSRLGLKKV